jgi:hypothetical protein
MTTKMERILVTFCFVFILEAVPAISTFILFFLFVCTKWSVGKFSAAEGMDIYFRSS